MRWPCGTPAPRRGEVILARGVLATPGGGRNPGSFDFRRYLRDRGIWATFHADSAAVVAPAHGTDAFAIRIEEALKTQLGAPAAAVMLGLLMGRSGEVPEDLLRSFRRSGTVHIFAVSGLHVGFVLLALHALLRTLRMPPRTARLLTLPFLAGFVLLVGVRPSLVRATVMATALLVSWSLERRSSPENALGVAAVVLLAARPGAFFDLGFRLSFAATAGVLVFFRPAEERLARLLSGLGRVGTFLASALALSLSAQLGVAPLLTATAGEISVLAPLANLIVVPLAGYGVASGIVSVATVGLPGVGEALAANAWASAVCLRQISAAVGSVSWACVPVASRFAGPLALGVLALALLVRAGHHSRRIGLALAASAVTLAGALAVWGPGRSYARALVFDVGQGDAILLEIPRRRYVLVDAGPGARANGGRDAGRDVLVPYLKKLGVRRLTALIVTHAHADHYGGCPAVLRAVGTRELVLPARRLADERLSAVLTRATELGAVTTECRAGETLFSGRYALEFLWPPRAETPTSENDHSIVVLFRAGEARFLLTGDIERFAELGLAESGRNLHVDVLKVAHHGGGTSTTERFLNSATPRLAVVSVGAHNRYGHPDHAVLERLDRIGCAVLRTDQDGGVVIDMLARDIVATGSASGRRVSLPITPRATRTRDPP